MSDTLIEPPPEKAPQKSSARASDSLPKQVWRNWRRMLRRINRPFRPADDSQNLLSLMIRVFAGFLQVDNQVLEEELDSTLGFLRYDYPEAVYSDLRAQLREALQSPQDLDSMAQQLAQELGDDQKISLCVQLYDLISKAELQQDQVAAYYQFVAGLGMAEQAIDIVYQLNASDGEGPLINRQDSSPLEMLQLSGSEPADILLPALDPGDRINAYRFHEMVLLKNQSDKPVMVRGRKLTRGQLSRIYSGQRIIVDEQVLSYQDLVFYFNAKKGVSVPHLYLSLDEDGEITLERSRSRDSCMEIRFGLRVTVIGLKEIDATLNGEKILPDKEITATLEDRIVFGDNSEISLADLRRRARAMGGRFMLNAAKTEYLVSNNPTLLQEDDILLSPGSSGEVLLRIFCDYDKKIGRLEVLKADRPIVVGDQPVRNKAALVDGDTIRIDTGQVLHCDFTERILEERRNIIRNLEVKDLTVQFPGGEIGLDGMSFNVSRGEMVCVMGASGSGKSTLLRTIAGQLTPTAGEVLLNGRSLYDTLEALKGYIAYVPQDDAFDEHLTIEENLSYSAAIRAPHLSRRDRMRRVDAKLTELGLSERRDSVVGTPSKKRLSGGERKRLNIGLDMIGSADVYLIDEPTSGLSSKDSEHIIDIIKSMSHNKIVLVTIHQPSSKLFHAFHKAMLLDKGGRLVFYGTPTEMLSYFAEAEHEQHFGTSLGGCPSCGTTRPEFIFDVLETPLRDLSGEIIYEENSRGQLVPARRYSPDYWRDKFESHAMLKDMRQVSLPREGAHPPAPTPIRKRAKWRWSDEWTQLRTLMRRAFKSKMRNRANLLTTMVEAPVLAVLIAAVLRYSENTAYTFAAAFHIPTYLFLMLVVVMFLGLTNSADDIIRDRAVLQRERNLNVRLSYYISAKFLTLGLFALLQCVLFIFIGNWILEIQEMFWIHLAFAFAIALTGVAIGLFTSSIVNDGKTAANVVPLVLIPQIILGGALIKYDEMNRDLDFLYRINRWFVDNPQQEMDPEEQSELSVPIVGEFMPMRWGYEALVVAQAKQNPLTRRQEEIYDEISGIVQKENKTDAELERLNKLKNALAIVSGLEAQSPGAVSRLLKMVDGLLKGKPVNLDALRVKSREQNVSADQLYVNQKVTDLVSKAEMEQKDYRGGEGIINVFFGPQKQYLGEIWSVYTINLIVLALTTFLFLLLLYGSLRHQLRLR